MSKKVSGAPQLIAICLEHSFADPKSESGCETFHDFFGFAYFCIFFTQNSRKNEKKIFHVSWLKLAIFWPENQFKLVCEPKYSNLGLTNVKNRFFNFFCLISV